MRIKMDARISSLAAVVGVNDLDFNSIQFEKRLMQLKDSQESINSLSAWCLEHRIHHKKIVNAWLNVLKKVKLEQRLTLFYLANDVIQYSKRKNYDFVESWATTLQKAATLVREEKVKNRILRIFKIWEQRGIYDQEFVADLSGLISASPTGRKFDQDPQDFQTSYLVNRIRSCAKLELETDTKLKLLKDNEPKIVDSETLCASLKDRHHVEDVEKDVEHGITVIEGYVNALKAEIKSRSHLISVLTQGEKFYETERKEVKVVVSAYRNFTSRVKILKRKLDEIMPTLNSPIPSPDVNAPSPISDSDMDLPNLDENVQSSLTCSVSAGVQVYATTQNYNAGYYTPAPLTQSRQDFANNGFSSFMGSDVPFDLQNFGQNNMFSERSDPDVYNPEHIPEQSYIAAPVTDASYNQQVTVPQTSDYRNSPLLPPPMPPFTTAPYDASYTDPTYRTTVDSYANNSTYEAIDSAAYAVTSEIQTPYQPDAYNPEEDLDTWEPDTNWEVPHDLETPESPPLFEKEGFSDPVEYDDSKSAAQDIDHRRDIDHRVLLPTPNLLRADSDTDHRSAIKDVDHRNLISLTGSPGNDSLSPGRLQPPPAPPALWTAQGDQDYRNHSDSQDQDYRVPVDIAQQLKLPPPPPPPSAVALHLLPTFNDNVESIDMDLSDDETQLNQPPPTQQQQQFNTNNMTNNNRRNNRPFGMLPSHNNKPGETIIEQNKLLDEDDQFIDESAGKRFLNDNHHQQQQQQQQQMVTHLPPPILPPHLVELNNGGGPVWSAAPPENWSEDLQLPPPPFPQKPRFPSDFRGSAGFRGRGGGARGSTNEIFTFDGGVSRGGGIENFRHHAERGGGNDFLNRGGRARGGGGIRGGNRTRNIRGGHNRGTRGFRGKFRGGF